MFNLEHTLEQKRPTPRALGDSNGAGANERERGGSWTRREERRGERKEETLGEKKSVGRNSRSGEGLVRACSAVSVELEML